MVECKYDWVSWFDEGLALAVVEKDGKWGFIDKKGKEVIKCKYDFDDEGDLFEPLGRIISDVYN